VGLGAQDLSEHSAGAFTGDVAAPMLRDVGCVGSCRALGASHAPR
jgi:triosephosphate isomerase